MIIDFFKMRINNLRNKLRLKKVVFEYSDLLSEGKYKLRTGSQTIMYLDIDEVTSFLKQHHDNLFKNYKKGLSHRLDPLFKFEVSKSKDEDFSGQLMMLTIERNVKIFDFKKGQVLTKYRNRENYLQIKKAVDILNSFFDHTILYFDDDYSQIEMLIGGKKNQKIYSDLSTLEKENVFGRLIMSYTNYFSQIDRKFISYVSAADMFVKLKGKVASIDYNCIKKFFLSSDSDHSLYPRVFLHGDLHSGNLLLDGETIRLIDFDCSRNCIFISDLFNFMFTQAVSQNNPSFLESYCNGKYDDEFYNLFAQFEMIYETSRRIEYLALVLADLILTRGLNKKDAKYLKEINRLYTRKFDDS